MQPSSTATTRTLLKAPNQPRIPQQTTPNNQSEPPNQSTPFPQNLTPPQARGHSEGFPLRLRAQLQQSPFMPASHTHVGNNTNTTLTAKKGWAELGDFEKNVAYIAASKFSENIKSILTAIPDEAEKNKMKDAISTCIVSMLLAKTTKEKTTFTEVDYLFQTLRETITNVKGLEKPAGTAQAIVAIVAIHIADTINTLKKQRSEADAR